jgi:hypothetical protein
VSPVGHAGGLDLDSRVDPEDLRDAWRAACDDVRAAYDAWCIAPTSEAGDRYCGFVAAADREEAAAAALKRRLRPVCAGKVRLDASQRGLLAR